MNESTPEFTMPTEAFGDPVEWNDGYRPTPIFLKCFSLPGGKFELFAVVFEMSESTSGEAWKFQEYVGVYSDAGKTTHLHFRQFNEKVVFTAGDEVSEIEADSKQNYPLFGSNGPIWKWSDAQWPYYQHRAMMFIGQATVTDDSGCSDETAYLFSDAKFAVFAVYEHMATYQSAEEHYDGEAESGRF